MGFTRAEENRHSMLSKKSFCELVLDILWEFREWPVFDSIVQLAEQMSDEYGLLQLGFLVLGYGGSTMGEQLCEAAARHGWFSMTRGDHLVEAKKWATEMVRAR